MKFLIPVDGSDISTNALKHALDLAKKLAKPPKLVVVAVDGELFPGVERKLGKAAAQELHTENFARLFAPARKALLRSKIDASFVEAVGEPSAAILKIAEKEKATQIIMGSRGAGAIKGALIGSISLKVLSQSHVPVTVVK